MRLGECVQIAHLEVQLEGYHKRAWDLRKSAQQAGPMAVRYKVGPCSGPDQSRHQRQQ